MKKLITILALGLLFACAPMAEFTTYDVYDHYPIYGMDKIKEMPPNDAELSEGESYVWYLGTLKQSYRRLGVTYVEIKKDNYVYTEMINCKVDISHGSKCFILKIRENDQLNTYLISEQKKYYIRINTL